MNEYQTMKAAGFNDLEIFTDMTERAKAAGFTDQEAAADILDQSVPPDQRAYEMLNSPNPALLDYFQKVLAGSQAAPEPTPQPKGKPLSGGPEDAVISGPQPGQGPDTIMTQEEPTYSQAVKTGFNQSIVGLYLAHLRGEDRAPVSVMGDMGPAEFRPGLTTEQQQDLPIGKRIAMQAAQIGGDLPAMAVGAAAGSAAGPAGAAAGAFAVPAGIRSILMAEYERGQIQTPQEFLFRGAMAMYEAGKGAAVGAATYGAGAAARVAAPLLQVPAEVVAMTTAGAAVEGHLPAARDFVDGAILIGGMHGAMALGGKVVRAAQDVTPRLRKIYEKTGIRPEQIIEDIKSDPSIRQDLMAVGGPEVPRAYTLFENEKATPVPGPAQNFEKVYPPAPEVVDGRTVRSEVPNTSSIGASLTDYTELPGIREVSFDSFDQMGELGYASKSERVRTQELAAKIKESGEINPLIVVIDNEGPYILEGGHRFDALRELGAKSFPAKVVLDNESISVTPITSGSLSAVVPTQKAQFDPNRPTMPAEPVGMDGTTKISDVVKLFEEKFNTPIRTGGFRDTASGVYKPGDKVIRTKVANNISTIAHEIGHDLQNTLFGAVTDAPLEPWRTELEAIATKPKAGGSVLGEGFAEFVARYVVNPADAQKVAPGFFKSFEASMDKTAPELKAVLLEAQGMVQKWKEQPSVMRVLSHVSIGEKPPSIFERATDPQGWNTLYTRVIDRLYPIQQVIKEGMRKGEELPADIDPYNLARRYAGATGAATSFIEVQPFRFADKKHVGKSYRSVLDGVENLDEFRAYLISKSQLERGDRGMLSPGFTEDAQAVVKALGPKYEAKAKELYAFKDLVIDYVRDSGIYSDETVQAWRDAWKSHVSFSRVMDAAENFGGTGKSMQAAQTVKRAKGSGRDIIDPLESTLEDSYRLLNMAERNRVVESLVKFAETHEGMGKWVEKVPSPQKQVKVRTDEILKAIEEYDQGASVHAAALFENADLGMTIFRPDSYLDKKTQIALFRDGKRSVYQVDPELANVVHNLDAQGMHMVTRILAAPARVLRVGATSTPQFLLANAIRDSFSAGVYSPGFIPIVDTVRGILAMMKNDRLYREWIEDGGEQFAMVGMDRASLQKNLKALTNTGVMDNTWNVIRHPIEMARVLGELSEGGTRVGAYMKDRRKLGDSMAARAEATLKSRDLLDFARKGGDPGIQWISQITAFWNARLQGSDKLIRAFKDDPVKTTLLATAIYTVPSIMLTVHNFVHEPQEEQDRVWNKAAMGQQLTPVEHDLYMRMQIRELPSWRRDFFWNVRAGDFIFPIPKGHELGVLFSAVPERITNWMLGRVHKNGSGEEFNGLVNSILGGASPGVLPTAAIVPVELWANKSMLFDRPIVPAGRQDLLPELQYTPNTTEAMKELSRVLGEHIGRTYTFSPARAEHLIRGWTGGLGEYVLRGTDWMLRSAGVVPNPPRADYKLSDVPGIKSFIVRYPSGGTESIAAFYDNYSKSQEYVKSISALQKEFQFARMSALMNEGGMNVMAGAYQAMNKMQTAIYQIDMNPILDGAKKRELIDSIYLQMNTVARHGNNTYKEMKQFMEDKK